jgi:anti-sigma-K factor RskA
VTCAEFKASVHAYALGALDPQERDACAAHLASAGPHEGCAEALARAEELVSELGWSLPVERPSPAVWTGIERRLGLDTGFGRGGGRGRRWREGFAWAALAAAVVALIWMSRRDGELELEADRARQVSAEAEAARQRCTRDLEQAQGQLATQKQALALLMRPATKVVQLKPPSPAPGAAYHGSAIMNTSEGRGFVLAGDLVPQSGKDYELWVIRGQQKLPAGLLRAGPSGTIVAEVDPKLLAPGPPDALAVTLEPEGGGNTPRGPILLVAAIPKT